MTRLKLNVRKGCRIDDISSRAARLAKQYGISVEFTFNGVLVVVNPGDSPTKAMVRYSYSAWKRST